MRSRARWFYWFGAAGAVGAFTGTGACVAPHMRGAASGQTVGPLAPTVFRRARRRGHGRGDVDVPWQRHVVFGDGTPTQTISPPTDDEPFARYPTIYQDDCGEDEWPGG